jgi:hypothetical protein
MRTGHMNGAADVALRGRTTPVNTSHVRLPLILLPTDYLPVLSHQLAHDGRLKGEGAA